MALQELSASGGLFWGKPAYVARTPWGPWLAVLATLAIIGFGMVVGGVVASLIGEPWGPVGVQSLELLGVGVGQILVVALTLLCGMMLGGRVGEVLALAWPRGAPGVYLQALLLLAVLNAAVSIVQYYLFPRDMFTDLRPFAGLMTGPDWLLALLVVGIGAPLSEELLFRGFLLSALAGTRFGFLGAALISTALWTSLHLSYTLLGIVEVFMIGLFFSWLLWRTGSLWVAISCHALYNSLIVFVLRYVPLPA